MKNSKLLLALWVASSAACAAQNHAHRDVAVHSHVCEQYEVDTEARKTCELENGLSTLVGRVNAGEGTLDDVMRTRQTADALAVVYKSQAGALAQGSADLDHLSRRRAYEACRIEKGEGHADCVALATHSYRLASSTPPVTSSAATPTAGIRLVVSGFTKPEVQWASGKPASWEVDLDQRRRTLAVSIGGVVKGHLSGDDGNFIAGSCYEFTQSPNGEVVITLCPADAEALPEAPPTP